MPRKRLHIIRWFFVFFCFSLVHHEETAAYIPQGAHLLELMTREIGRPDSILVQQKQFLPALKPDGAPTVFSETLRYLLPRKFRSDIQTSQALWVRVLSGSRAITIVDGTSSANAAEGFDLYPEILMHQSRPSLQRRLVELGVDVRQSSWGLFQGRPVYVIGAKYPKIESPQLWIEKESLRPVRWIVSVRQNQHGRQVKEIRYLEWKNVGPYGYPMRIEFYRDDMLVRHIEAANVAVNEFFEERFFDIDRIAIENPPRKDSESGANSGGAGAIQQSIDEFRKIMD